MSDDSGQRPVLRAVGLSKSFAVSGGRGRGRRFVHAVNNADLSLVPGEIVAVVGESGSGKTTLGRMMTRLERPTHGEILLNGASVPRRGTSALRPFHLRL